MELSHERGSGESRGFLEMSYFRMKVILGIRCKNCFKVFGSAAWSMESNTCGKTCIAQALSIASWQNPKYIISYSN